MATSANFRVARKRARPFAIARGPRPPRPAGLHAAYCPYSPPRCTLARPQQLKYKASPSKVATSEKFRVARKRARPSAIACDHPTQQGLSMRFGQIQKLMHTDRPEGPY
ncbi:hypothetical protein EDB84DRAFT_1438288 [Lactarius hengduanensis]|nr:hypothetical protein EDB84DRAFT_1438288 [Lactarius hengduanensis]